MLKNKVYLEKYYKQIILKNIGLPGQKKIFNSKVLIVGMGGLGCPLLMYLANSGVGKIGIVDNDKVELSNLNRQVLYTNMDLGKYKVDCAKKNIELSNKDIKIKTYNKRLNVNNIMNILGKYEIICDGTDNFETRYLINDYCLKNKKVLISAAISKFEGHLFKFDFKKNIPCFRCYMPEIPSNENNCETDGIFSPVCGVLGTLQANEVLKTILEKEDDLSGKMIIFNSIKSEFRKIKLSNNTFCKNKCLN